MRSRAAHRALRMAELLLSPTHMLPPVRPSDERECAGGVDARRQRRESSDMAILQVILAWIGRSLGSLLNTLFGWAVLALFGRTFGKQHALLVTLTALAALW